MSEPLEELRAQRALIQKHLNWLDAQITHAESSGRESSQSPTPSTDEITSKAATEPVTVETPPVVSISEQTAPVSTVAKPIHDIDEFTPAGSNGSDLRRAQIGCLAFFAIVTLSFLFLLFGLPYLID
jgi:hypothetical protein